MKSFTGFCIFLLYSTNIFPQTFADDYAIKSSISEIISEVYPNKKIFFISDDANGSHRELINHVLSAASNLSVQIESFDGIRKLPERRKNSIIFIDSFESFGRLHEILNDQSFDFDGFYLIVCLDITAAEANAMFRRLWKKFIYNVGLLTLVNEAVTLQTFIPFGKKKCFDTDTEVINVFDGDRWSTNAFFPQKLKNFQQCPISVTTFEYAPTVIVKKLYNGSIELVGSDIELLNGLSVVLNFKIELNFLPNFGDWGVLYENGTATGAHKLLVEKKTDAMIGWFYVSYMKTLFMASSEPYFMVPLNIIIPSGSSFTPLQKLLIPFEPNVWILLLIVLLIALLVILTVEYRARHLRNFIIGSNVRSPLMELLVVLCGLSSHSLPRQQFPRYLLTMFLLFCLVMRTLYQSALFKFMQSDRTGNGVTSIDEMMNEGFTIYSYPSLEPFWKEMKFSNMYDSKFKGVVLLLTNTVFK